MIQSIGAVRDDAGHITARGLADAQRIEFPTKRLKNAAALICRGDAYK